MPQVREPREYEDKSDDNKDRPAQPLGHRFFTWAVSTYEGRVEFAARKECEENARNPYDYLKNSCCHGLPSL